MNIDNQNNSTNPSINTNDLFMFIKSLFNEDLSEESNTANLYIKRYNLQYEDIVDDLTLLINKYNMNQKHLLSIIAYSIYKPNVVFDYISSNIGYVDTRIIVMLIHLSRLICLRKEILK